ncbi:E3 ubiquitin-protein ligase rnf5 [Balamuthia mandrillaris]
MEGPQHTTDLHGNGGSDPPKNKETDNATAQEEEAFSPFECNVCLDAADEPVVTPCGHLYCWPCIFRWLEIHPDSPSCPVCKSVLSKEQLIPIYGRGQTQPTQRKRPSATPAEEIPKRPTGHRGESVRQSNPQRGPHMDNFIPPPFGYQRTWGGGNGGNFQMGVGVFPFPFFGLQFAAGAFGGPAAPPGRELTEEEQQQAQLSRLLFAVGLFLDDVKLEGCSPSSTQASKKNSFLLLLCPSSPIPSKTTNEDTNMSTDNVELDLEAAKEEYKQKMRIKAEEKKLKKDEKKLHKKEKKMQKREEKLVKKASDLETRAAKVERKKEKVSALKGGPTDE